MSLNPEVLILGEPFAGLDRSSSDMLMEFITELKSSGKTPLIATHNPAVREKSRTMCWLRAMTELRELLFNVNKFKKLLSHN